MKTCKIAIIGGGPGGYVAAIRAAQLGAKVILIERDQIGGLCLNHGCIPTKTLLRSAKLYKDLKEASKYGIDIGSEIRVNWPNLLNRKDKIVKQLVTGVESLLEKNGIEVIQGDAKAVSAHKLWVGDQEIECEHLVLATGTSVAIPPFPGIMDAIASGIAMDTNEIIQLTELPKSILILGGGVAAIEFAALFSGLGSEVVILQRSDQILKNLDQDVRIAIHFQLEREGIQIATGAKIVAIAEHEVTYDEKGVTKRFSAEKILMCLGRKPNLEGLEALNLELMSGAVKTSSHMETSVKDVYAVGDLNGKQMLAHVASAEGIVAVEHIMGQTDALDYLKIPSCIYSLPEVGMVGMTEEEARDSGKSIVISKFPMNANGKAVAEGEALGFVKIIAEQNTGNILGVHIVASHATDMIAEAVATMSMNGTVRELSKIIHPHPTLSESIMEAASGAVDRPIHLFK